MEQIVDILVGQAPEGMEFLAYAVKSAFGAIIITSIVWLLIGWVQKLF